VGEVRRVWQVLAERYKNEPTVAAYDIFNEPMPKDEFLPRRELARLVAEFYEYVAAKIREVDDRHIVMSMSIWGSDPYNVPRCNISNAVFTAHYYV